MKVYICDACGAMIKDGYAARMREYFFDTVCDAGAVWPRPTRKTTTVQLCDECFHGLRVIAAKVAGGTE